MAETVNIPGIGPVKQPLVIGVGALGLGVVAYAWYTKGNRTAEAELLPNPEMIPETERTPVVGDSSGNWDETDDDAITTNAQWTTKATEYLIMLNHDATAAGSALGAFLARKPLTAAQVDMVLTAKGAFGDPPIGGPWPVTAAPAGAELVAPKNFRVTGSRTLASGPSYARVDLEWDPVPGAIGYQLTAYDATAQAAAGDQDSADTTHLYQPILRGHTYQFTVAAKNSAGAGPTSTVSATTPK
jgi:hypothetical protein